MSIDDKARELDRDSPLHPDNLPGDVAHDLYDTPDVGGEKEHEAKIDLDYEQNRRDYNKD